MDRQFDLSGGGRFHLRLGALFRIQAAVGILLTVIILLSQRPADMRGRAASSFGFVLLTSALACATYAASRIVFSRFTSPLLAVLISGITGAAFSRPKVENPAELAVLGMCVAISWILGMAWLDVRDDAPRRSQ